MHSTDGHTHATYTISHWMSNNRIWYKLLQFSSHFIVPRLRLLLFIHMNFGDSNGNWVCVCVCVSDSMRVCDWLSWILCIELLYCDLLNRICIYRSMRQQKCNMHTSHTNERAKRRTDKKTLTIETKWFYWFQCLMRIFDTGWLIYLFENEKHPNSANSAIMPNLALKLNAFLRHSTTDCCEATIFYCL